MTIIAQMRKIIHMLRLVLYLNKKLTRMLTWLRFHASWWHQKQQFTEVFRNRCSYKFRNIHRKTSMLESPSDKVVGLNTCNFTEKRLQHRCFLMDIAKFLRATFFIEYLRWLHLWGKSFSGKWSCGKKFHHFVFSKLNFT